MTAGVLKVAPAVIVPMVHRGPKVEDSMSYRTILVHCDVMGIYGHSRMREMVLGGVSRTLLSSMTVPVFMEH